MSIYGNRKGTCMLGQKKIPYLAKEPLLKKKRLGYSIFVPYAWYPLKKDS
jgi:hypothetical protein